MSLDERLRADLRREPLSTPDDVRASLDTVLGIGRKRRRRRAIILPAVLVAVAIVGATVVGIRMRYESGLDVIGPPPSSLTTPTQPASTSTVGAPTTPTGAPTGDARPTSAPTTSAAPPVTSPPTSSSTSSSTSSTSSTSIPGSVPVDLTFTGAVAGHVTTATAAPIGLVVGPHTSADSSPACTSAADGPSGATFGVQGTLAGSPFLLSYSVGDVHDVTGGLAEGIAIVGHPTLDYRQAYSYDPSRVVVDADRKGGEIDADLVSGAATVVGHVRGHFRCAA